MALDLSSPFVQSVLIPVAGAFALTGAIRFANGRAKGPIVANAAVGLAFLIGDVIIGGFPALPPESLLDKVTLIALGGLLMGFLLDFFRRPPIQREALFALGSAAALYWMALPLLDGASAWLLAGLVALWLAGLIAGFRVEQGLPPVLDASMLLLVGALGVGAIASFGHADTHARLAFALATALGGFMIWNWPKARYPFGAALLLGGGGALFALVVALALESGASHYALAILLLSFFAAPIAKRVKLPGGRLGEALRPFVLGAIALIPALAALAIAYFTSGDAPMARPTPF